MAKTIGFVGVGPINAALAQFSIDAGYKVIVSNSRGPETLTDIVAELGENASAATVKEVNQKSDITIISIPLHKLNTLDASLFVNKIVIDTNNYYPERDGVIEELEKREINTAEMIQRHLKGSFIVKALHNLDFCHFKNGPKPAGDPARWALPLAGDNIEAKAEVSTFMDKIGFDPVDCGILADSWKIQQATPVYVIPYVGKAPEGIAGKERMDWFRSDRAAVVKAEDVLRLVNQAKKSDRVGALFEDLPAGCIN